MRRACLLLLIPLVLLGSCSDDDAVVTGGSGGSTTSPPSEAGEGQRYEATGTVLESPDHGPQLCLGAVEDSYPPQCGGPDLVGWDWEAVDDAESANGTTWGSYHVVGTSEDGTFTLTEPAGPAEPVERDDVDFTAPCPEPAGGWAVVDVATTTDAAQAAANEHAARQPDYAGSWVDQSVNPAMADGFDPGDEEQANDPTKLVLVVRFTGELERHEQELRELWGGALCVTGAERTEAELAAIQEEVSREPGLLWSSPDVVGNRVELGVILDDGVQARLDERFGDGVVVVQPALRPVG